MPEKTLERRVAELEAKLRAQATATRRMVVLANHFEKLLSEVAPEAAESLRAVAEEMRTSITALDWPDPEAWEPPDPPDLPRGQRPVASLRGGPPASELLASRRHRGRVTVPPSKPLPPAADRPRPPPPSELLAARGGRRVTVPPSKAPPPEGVSNTVIASSEPTPSASELVAAKRGRRVVVPPSRAPEPPPPPVARTPDVTEPPPRDETPTGPPEADDRPTEPGVGGP